MRLAPRGTSYRATTDVFGKTTQFTYDEAGNLIKTTDANGHVTKYEYDAMNRKTAAIDGNGHSTETKYNLRGEVIAITNANGETVKSEYDAVGRLTKVINPLGFETRYQYDVNGNQTCLIDANATSAGTDPGHQPVNADGCTESRVYDELGRLTQSKDAQGNITAYSYDLLGNRLTVTDAENHTTAFHYDDLGRLIETIDPLIETPTDKTQLFAYDEAGNLIEETDRKGQISRHTYDSLNRITQTDHLTDNTQETYTYDLYGDLIQTQNADVTYTYTYTAKHQLQSKTDSRANKTLSWAFDPAGNIDTKTDYQGDVTDYQYDNANRLVAETNPAYLQVSYHYDPAGYLLDRILSNGAQIRYGWDTAGRLTQLKNTTLIGQLVNDTSYARDRLGNILSQTEHNAQGQATGTTTFGYDPEYRLLTAEYPGTANDESFSYDKVGNRKTYTQNSIIRYYNVDAGNRLKDIRTGSGTGTVFESYQYDANGSLTNISGNRNLTLTWDANNRVKQINTSQYRYDPKGYRIQKTAAATHRYYLEGEHLEAIYDGNGALREQYLRGTVIDEVVNGYRRDANNVLINTTYHHDALQSVLGQSGHDGQVQATQRYTAFGGSLSATGTSNSTQKYTGRELDGESGFYYYRARYYDPSIGGFISEDPMGFEAGDVNFYAYVGNNPVNGNDPTGEVLNLLIGGGTSVALGYGISMLTGQEYTFADAARDAAFGAVGAGILGKINTLNKLNEINQLTTAGRNLVTSGAAPKFTSTISQSLTKIEANKLGQSFVSQGEQFSFRAPALKVKTGIVQANFESSVLKSSGNPKIITNIHANVTPLGTNVSEGFAGGIFGGTTSYATANGGFVLYPNKSNTNQMASVYAK